MVNFKQALLISCCLLSISANAKNELDQFKVSPPFGKTSIGRCHMDSCSWGKVLNKKVISSSSKTMNVEATILGGQSSMNGNDKIKWNKASHKVIAICSKSNPSMIIEDQVTQLNVRDFPAVEESDVNLYF
ncbi:hypothetical protein NQU59_11595 [Acinetobacter colistiniresistens]|uniref:hypothetical protein n=1 Tax=Acinetobacter colistiniresistens TaxID=280145 RepID=UPI00211BFDCF|nr:hypothetical protein [Acinetobacter colistiniresistens]UUM26344.1 hypothetical protein NQU59_11595 [Acinetobacter colistiniresistens]